MFAMHYKSSELFKSLNYDLIAEILLWSLTAVYFLIFLSIVVLNLYDLYLSKTEKHSNPK
jgi:hypothetical protein